MSESKSGAATGIVVLLFKLVVAAITIAIPLLGAWVGSSLAAFANGPLWAAPLAALAAFPLLPVVWDRVAQWRRKGDAKRFLTFFDRLILRTLAINVVFLGGLLLLGGDMLFTALSARGDWMLDGRGGTTVERVRGSLFATADGLEWAFKALSEENKFEDLVRDDKKEPQADTSKSKDDRGKDVAKRSKDNPPTPAPTTRSSAAPEQPNRPDPKPNAEAPTGGKSAWPFANQLHPGATTVPKSAEESVKSLGAYLGNAESHPVQRVKLIHDWIADRISYDVDVYNRIMSGQRVSWKTQSPEALLEHRRGVCAGYSNLFKALADVAGIDSRVITGHTRESASVGGVGHAWNAVKIEDRWYLVDVTWDAGSVGEQGFKKRYKADYFLTPAKVFGITHLPKSTDWQLRREPLSKGEFIRQPNLKPGFFLHGFELNGPDRSQVTVSESVAIKVDNPKRHALMVTYEPKDGGKREKCGTSDNTSIIINCKLPQSGIYKLLLFGNEKKFGHYWSVGSFEVVRR